MRGKNCNFFQRLADALDEASVVIEDSRRSLKPHIATARLWWHGFAWLSISVGLWLIITFPIIYALTTIGD